MTHVDFNLHGIVGIRVIDARPAELAAVRRQLGRIEAPLTRDPDLVIRFVRRIPVTRPLRFVSLGESAEADGRFFVLHGRDGAMTRVAIPLDAVDSGLEITCERGTRGVPHLIALVNLIALARGFVPLHASSFLWDGRGVVVTGWAKGGKTEVLLGMASRGARHIGDEWIYLDPQERRMYGIREPVRVWDWHLRQFPEYRPRVPRSKLRRLDLLRPGVAVVSALETAAAKRHGVVAGVLRRVGPVARRRLSIQVEPERLFAVPPLEDGPISAVIMVANHDSADIAVERISTADVVDRMTHSLAYERLSLQALHDEYGFALPGRRSALIDTAPARERELLQSALDGVPAHLVWHPYPVDIRRLCDRIEALLDATVA